VLWSGLLSLLYMHAWVGWVRFNDGLIAAASGAFTSWHLISPPTNKRIVNRHEPYRDYVQFINTLPLPLSLPFYWKQYKLQWCGSCWAYRSYYCIFRLHCFYLLHFIFINWVTKTFHYSRLSECGLSKFAVSTRLMWFPFSDWGRSTKGACC